MAPRRKSDQLSGSNSIRHSDVVVRNKPQKCGQRTNKFKKPRVESRADSARDSSVEIIEIAPQSASTECASSSSLFSIQTLSTLSSTFDDGFTDLDFQFNPADFPLEVGERGLHPTWLEPLKQVFTQPEIISLHQKLGKTPLGYDYKAGERPPLLAEIYPAARDLYNWSRLTPLDKVKVVILGSTPLSCPGYANGLAFSQSVGTLVSGSMRNIHYELANQYPESFVRPTHGSLVSWARAGVLLLNIIHTTQRDSNTAHAEFGWDQFTCKVLETVDHEGGLSTGAAGDSKKGLVFIVWGPLAAKQIEQARIASSSRKHKILSISATPEPDSAHEDGFFHNDHFKLANKFLSEEYGAKHEINWCDLKAENPE